MEATNAITSIIEYVRAYMPAHTTVHSDANRIIVVDNITGGKLAVAADGSIIADASIREDVTAMIRVLKRAIGF